MSLRTQLTLFMALTVAAAVVVVSLAAYFAAIARLPSVLQLLMITYSQFSYVCTRTLSMLWARNFSPL